MTVAAPAALAGLLLLVPIVLAHLRRRRERRVAVPALDLWRELAADAPTPRRRLRMPALPLLLALQALAVVALVLAVAGLARRSRRRAAGPG